ncbi:hypothetical protein BX616_000588 [Lobosporangium transversale]|uniref:PLC-like phosphodiesterase n=1 Tax=Lobosporangium transversale TaxID=64571 RepID=A0A1Y2GR47_9FUNG|nr:PLC-like phosphodiesterase [Lobosporangium transversale]KAF9906881.1 hypothetical protein BX616_000588 [Lobosporangium transversale]ORZ16796.1 PLC-like phosphodiesterase [Lobosporangium transversale]|eukprot:XP_021881731.1 PLC-like phosphodiesterase [Lobosporangium transversale]
MRSFIALPLSVLLVSTLVVRSEAQQLCNGYAELCGKTYDKVAYATTHNAYAYTPPGSLATNQDNDIPTQLKDGIRAFMLDGYPTTPNSPNDIQLCHTSCDMLNAGPLSKVLGQIKTFMDENPNEVITILWENAGNLKPAQFRAAYTAAGMDKYSHAQTAGTTAWPTLAQMISSGKRLVTFLDKGADASVPWLMAEYNFIFETPWHVTKDSPYPCTIDRPKDQRKQMYVLNHFIYGQFELGGESISIPQPGAANQTNSADLTSHINDCQKTFKQIPSFIAVDFYQKGSVMQALAQINGVKWNRQEPTQKGVTGGSGAGSGSGSGSESGSKNEALGRRYTNIGAMTVVALAGGIAMMAF